jgi:hypothetical protein
VLPSLSTNTASCRALVFNTPSPKTGFFSTASSPFAVLDSTSVESIVIHVLPIFIQLYKETEPLARSSRADELFFKSNTLRGIASDGYRMSRSVPSDPPDNGEYFPYAGDQAMLRFKSACCIYYVYRLSRMGRACQFPRWTLYG